MSDSTQRFSDRVSYYIQYRPKYPPEMLDWFRDELGLEPSHIIADAGSGTGLLSELFLANGNRVIGVEPNREMREAAESLLRDYKNFEIVDGTAEATGLHNDSVDFITAGQAFHWFDPVATKVEFARFLKPGGTVALIWNSRLSDSTPFAVAYEQLLRTYGTDYAKVDQRTVTSTDIGTLDRFFAPAGFQLKTFDNHQSFDFESLRGRVLSSSYSPMPVHPKHDAMMAALRQIYDRYQEQGTVRFDYATQVYYGRIATESHRKTRKEPGVSGAL